MNMLFYIGVEILPSLLILIPVFFLLDNRLWKNPRRTASLLLLSFYFAGVYAVAGLPNIAYFRFYPRFNFRPFAYMFSDLRSTIPNVVLFVPLGAALPLLWKKFRSFWITLLSGFGFSFLIEFLQIFTHRATDVNDLMTNTLGTLLGWITGRLLLRFVPAIVPGENTRELPLVFAVTFGVMFVCHPILSALVSGILG